MTTQVPFDTLEYAKILIDAGMDRSLAEAQSEAQVKMISSIVNEKLATKDDIKELKSDIKELKLDTELKFNELDKKITDVDNRLSGQITELDNRLSGQITQLDNRLSGQIAELKIDGNDMKNRIDNLETKLVVKLGGIVVIALTAMTVLMKVCHF